MLIVADTSPLNYLVLVQADHVLPKLYGTVLIPSLVLEELRAEQTGDAVKQWAAIPPAWLIVREPIHVDMSLLVDPGEAAAISLAREIKADRLLIDDRDGRAIAESLGLHVAGTLAVIRDAALEGIIDIVATFSRLRQTTFRASPELYEQLLADFEGQLRKTRP